MRTLMFVLIILICPVVSTANDVVTAEPDHYCQDKAMWAEWTNLVAKFPADDEVMAAYGLRLGLCSLIELEQIDTDRTIKIFDDFMAALKAEAGRQEEEEKRQKNGRDPV